MVKLLDPFSGYLLAYGNGLLHFAYFIAILIIPKTETCEKAYYAVCWKLLLSSHILIFAIGIIKFFLKTFGKEYCGAKHGTYGFD